MKTHKPDEMERSHNTKSARNAFVFYAVTLFLWTIYDLIDTGDVGLQMTVFSGGLLVFVWTKIYLYKQTETADKKIRIPSKAILWLMFYFVVFLALIFIIGFYF